MLIERMGWGERKNRASHVSLPAINMILERYSALSIPSKPKFLSIHCMQYWRDMFYPLYCTYKTILDLVSLLTRTCNTCVPLPSSLPSSILKPMLSLSSSSSLLPVLLSVFSTPFDFTDFWVCVPLSLPLPLD